MKKVICLLLAALTAGLFTGCTDKVDEVQCNPAEVTGYMSLSAFSKRHGAPTTVYSASVNGTVTSNWSTISFGPVQVWNNQPFVHANGQPANGPVQLQFRAITDRAQMILSNATTVTTAGEPLESAGEYYLRATQNGQPLRLRNGSRLSFVAPPPARQLVAAPSQMRLFLGDTTLTGGLAWALSPAADTASWVAPVAGGFYVSLWPSAFSSNSLGNLGWINCDAFFNDPAPRTTVTLNVPDAVFNDHNTRVYLVFHSRNSVMPMFQLSGNTQYQVSNVPTGQQVSAVVLRTDGTQFYYGEQSATVAANQAFNMTLQAMSETDVVAKINKFK